MPTREIKRTPAFFPINIPEDASSNSSASPMYLSPLVSGTAQIVTVLANPTTDQDASDEAPDSRVGSIDRDSQDMEQLEYQYRPMTPGEEEIMRIHEDVIYQSWRKLLLGDTPEPGTPPVLSTGPESTLTLGAARITTEVVNGSAEDMEAYQLEVIVERLLPWLKDDVSSS